MNPPESVPNDKPRHRFWIPAVILLLWVALQGVLKFGTEIDYNIRSWVGLATLLLAFVLILLWFLLLSRFRWRLRLVITCVILGLGFVGSRLLKVDGTADGTGRPRLVWKWAPTLSERAAVVQRTARTAPGTGRPDDVRTMAVAGALDVPQFFGASRDGKAPSAGLASDWFGRLPRELWRQPIGLGWSAFAVVGNRAYTQEQRGDGEWISCYDLLTGRSVWAHTNQVRFSQWQGGDGPRSTPTVMEGRVYALGATGILDCLDAGTGALVWSRQVLTDEHISNLTWGLSASPLVVDDRVIIPGGSSEGASLLAYRRTDGVLLWKQGRERATYASPVSAVLLGEKVVLCVNAGSLTVHEPASGRILLTYPWGDDKRPKASQPVVVDRDRVFLTAGYGLGCVMLRVRKSESGDGWSVEELWKNKAMKTQFNSVAVSGGAAYGLDDGFLACVDLEAGTRVWKDGRYGSGQSLLVGDRVLIQSEQGFVVFAEATRAGFRELGRVEALHSKTWNHPVLAGRYLLVRNDQEAACYELPVEAGR